MCAITFKSPLVAAEGPELRNTPLGLRSYETIQAWMATYFCLKGNMNNRGHLDLLFVFIAGSGTGNLSRLFFVVMPKSTKSGSDWQKRLWCGSKYRRWRSAGPRQRHSKTGRDREWWRTVSLLALAISTQGHINVRLFCLLRHMG